MKKSNFLSLVGIILLMTTLMAASCHKDVITKPTISSFTLSSVTMTTATFNFSVSNYTSLKVVINGVETMISGGSYTASNLSANQYYTITLIASNQNGSVSKAENFTTSKSSLAITNFKITDSTERGASFTFSANSNASIVSQTLTNNKTGEVIDITGKTDFAIANLLPNTLYNFTFKVKDTTNNEVANTISFKTKEKVSDWLSIKSITYDSAFAIVGNAVSVKLSIKLENKAGGIKTLDTLKANFGEYGKAVKMLRYLDVKNSWVKLTADNGKITFTNLLLSAGENTIICRFSLKQNVGGVANGSPLNFSITSINDGDYATLPMGESFPAPISVGSVNGSTMPTIITTNWYGKMDASIVSISPNAAGYLDIYSSVMVKATGPIGAKFKSIKLKNPYASTGMLFGYQDKWSYALADGVGKFVKSFYWEGDNINLIMPEEANLATDGITFNNYYIDAFCKNLGSERFFSNEFTPGKTGFRLMSKYDLVFINSDGQEIDLSDNNIYQDNILLNN